MDPVSASLLWNIFKHIRSWLANLDRAGKERQEESVKALREVIVASRETAVYIRQMKDSAKRNHSREVHLSVLWTNLGFSLEDLGIGKLAKRCQIKGKHWSNPTHYDEEFLKNSDVSLDRMERLASEILRQIAR